jgi:4-amino-4-deoxy-L-arabinose transferase-like glycosyltransferase
LTGRPPESSAVPLPDFLRRRPWLAVFALALLLGLAFQGTRGLWEPDEGRYTNVALQMIHSGDWISLRRNDTALHFTKPPVTYWAIAASVETFGRNEWAVRLPMALAYALTVLMVFQLGKRFVPERPWLPALIYASSPIPFLATNTVNTDTVLASMEALSVLCFVQYRFGSGSTRWLDAMWAAFGLAFLTKGPPSLLPLLAIVAFEISQGRARTLLRPLGMLAFALIGFSWFLVVINRHPGLLDYFLGHEVYARIATNELKRYPEWYGPLVIYLPTLVVGMLPWLFAVRKPALPRWAWLDTQSRFLWIWLALPLLVFCLARSRLPLYLLPLFAPISLLLARNISAHWSANSSRLVAIWITAWLVLLLGLKYWVSALYVTDKDGRPFAAQLQPMIPGHPDKLVFVEDMTRNGLNLYMDTDIERVSFKPIQKMISDSSYDGTLSEALVQPGNRRVFIMKKNVESFFLDSAKGAHKSPVLLGRIDDAQKRPERERVVYTLAGDFPSGIAP